MKLSKKRTILLIVIVIILVGFVAAYCWLTGSNQGNIKQPTATKNQTHAITYKTLHGKYMQFSYPSIYQPQTLTAKDNDLELYKLIADTEYTKQLAVSVSQLPNNDLTNSSAYLLRSSRPDLYTQRMVSVGTTNVGVWTRNDGQEQTAFLVHDDKVAVLAFTQQGGDTTAFTAEVNALVQSFRWL